MSWMPRLRPSCQLIFVWIASVACHLWMCFVSRDCTTWTLSMHFTSGPTTRVVARLMVRSPPAFSHITFHFSGLTACGFVSCLVLNLYRASTEPVDNKCTRLKKRSLGGKDALLLTLVILRTGMTQKVAGALFGVHESTVTNYFTTWISFLAELFKRQQPYPSQQRVQKIHPVGYMHVFGHDRVRIMVDSSNVDTNAPSDADASGGLFSRYYSGNYPPLPFIVCIRPAWCSASMSVTV